MSSKVSKLLLTAVSDKKYIQGTPEWYAARVGRITASKVSVVAGNSRWQTREEFKKNFLKERRLEYYTEQSRNDDMLHGIKWEPIVRNYYSHTTGNEVEEMPFIIPEWDDRIGASVDGKVKDKRIILEIKCPPRKMYYKLETYCRDLDNGWIPPPHYHKHIFIEHYDQMQMGMAVLDADECHYIVYCNAENKLFMTAVMFNKNYWENKLYSSIKEFFKEIDSLDEDAVDSE
jgi:putative phage-type endonuclease